MKSCTVMKVAEDFWREQQHRECSEATGSGGQPRPEDTEEKDHVHRRGFGKSAAAVS